MKPNRIVLWGGVLTFATGGLLGSVSPEPLVWALGVVVLIIVAVQDLDKQRKLAKAVKASVPADPIQPGATDPPKRTP